MATIDQLLKAKPPRERPGGKRKADDDLYGGTPAEATDATPTHRLLLAHIEPDPEQPRWVLPNALRLRYQAGTLSAAEAVKEWKALVDAGAPLAHGKAFASLQALADSIRVGGLVNAITVVKINPGRYRIETGEQRFWAHWILVALQDHTDASQIGAVIKEAFNPWHQAVENTHQEPLNAVALSRQIIRLLVQQHDQANGSQTTLASLADYRRWAERRWTQESWVGIAEALGKQYTLLQQIMKLSALPEPLILMADSEGLTERQLRPLSRLDDPERQLAVAELAVEFGLSAREIEAACAAPDLAALRRELAERQVAGADEHEAGAQPLAGPKSPTGKKKLTDTTVLGLGRSVASRIHALHVLTELDAAGHDPIQAAVEHYAKLDRLEQAAAELRSAERVIGRLLKGIATRQKRQAPPKPAPRPRR